MTTAASTPSTAEPIRIFRTGEFVSREGRTVSFDASALRALADDYNARASTDPAPLVIGHPEVSAPAYGWVERLAVEGDTLVAYPDPAQTDASFTDIVRAGRYRKISAQFYPPEAASNPTPGRYSLKHVGFLGAHAPGVPGLGTVSLSADDQGVTIDTDPVSFSDQENSMTGTPAAVAAPAANAADQTASFAAREAALHEREQAIAAREQEIAEQAAAARHDANVSFAAGLVAQGRVTPAAKDRVVAVLDALAAQPEVVSFGEAETDKAAPVQILRELLAAAKPMISFSEAAPANAAVNAPSISFAAPTGYRVDAQQAAIYARAKALQAENANLSLIDAVKQASA